MIYTIGNPEVYDALLQSDNRKFKIGKREVCENWPEGFCGGSVFETVEEANKFRVKKYTEFEFDCDVYALDATWNDDFVYYVTHNEPFADLEVPFKTYHLLKDALILHKVLHS